MKPNIVLLATISCLLIGCHSETETIISTEQTIISAEQARINTQIALVEQKKEIEKEKDRKHEICKKEHVNWIKSRIEWASRQGETGTFISIYHCSTSLGCFNVFSCKNETNEFIINLKQHGYKVEEATDFPTIDGATATHYVSWSSK